MLNQIFPWAHAGATFQRIWPIAPTSEALEIRWKELFVMGSADPVLFAPDRDRTVSSQRDDLFTGEELPPLSDSCASQTLITPVRYSYRAFDRQWCIPDHRVGTFLRQPLWDSYSEKQMYLTTVSTTALGKGPAVTVNPYVPDRHAFRGSYGAKDVYPLYRSDSGDPNISKAFVTYLSESYGCEVKPFEILSYVMGQLGTGAYSSHFENELAENPAHVIFTADYGTFIEVAEFGRELIFEQTWGERGGKLNQFGQPTGERFKGSASIVQSTPQDGYPESWSYDENTHRLNVSGGIFANVLPEVVHFEVSGLNVLSSWLGYRMKSPSGKSYSPLDRIQASSWVHDGELLELLWQLEFFVRAETRGAELLAKVISGEKINPAEVDQPAAAEKKAPAKKVSGTIL